MNGSTSETKDPICGMTVDETTALRAERDGKTFYFCSDHCWQEFLSTPPVAEPEDKSGCCCGEVPTLEMLAYVSIMREHLPNLKIRVVNVVDLMKLQAQSERPHVLNDMDFDALFTKDKLLEQKQ